MAYGDALRGYQDAMQSHRQRLLIGIAQQQAMQRQRLAQQRFMMDMAAKEAAAQREGDRLRMGQDRLNLDTQRFQSEDNRNKATAAKTMAQTEALKQAAVAAALRQRLQQAAANPNIMAMVQSPTAGPQLMEDLRSSGQIPQEGVDIPADQLKQYINSAVMAAIQGQVGSTPASAAKLMPPQINPYQTGMLDVARGRAAEVARHNQAMEAQREASGANRLIPEDYRVATALGALANQFGNQYKSFGKYPDLSDSNSPAASAFRDWTNTTAQSKAVVDALQQRLKRQATGDYQASAPSGGGDVKDYIRQDSKGQTWKYKGSMPDPTMDSDPSNWEKQ